MSEYREGGIEKVRHDVAGYTREQPIIALLITAGTGLVLGWLSAVGPSLTRSEARGHS